MLDLTEGTFIPELTVPCAYAGLPLVFGCVIERNCEHGRPDVSGGLPSALRLGSASHARIYLRQCDPALAGVRLKPGDAIVADGSDWKVLAVRRDGGAFELTAEESGSRNLNSNRRLP